MTQLLFTTSMFQNWLSSCRVGDLQTLQEPSGHGKNRMVKTQKKRMFSVFEFTSVDTWMFPNRCCLGIPHPLCPEWQSCGMYGAFVTPERERDHDAGGWKQFTRNHTVSDDVSKKSKNLMQPSAQRRAVNSTQCRQLNTGPSAERRAVNST